MAQVGQKQQMPACPASANHTGQMKTLLGAQQQKLPSHSDHCCQFGPIFFTETLLRGREEHSTGHNNSDGFSKMFWGLIAEKILFKLMSTHMHCITIISRCWSDSDQKVKITVGDITTMYLFLQGFFLNVLFWPNIEIHCFHPRLSYFLTSLPGQENRALQNHVKIRMMRTGA